jgi:hypothetical protein
MHTAGAGVHGKGQLSLGVSQGAQLMRASREVVLHAKELACQENLIRRPSRDYFTELPNSPFCKHWQRGNAQPCGMKNVLTSRLKKRLTFTDIVN